MNHPSYGLDITHKTDLVGICYTMWFNAVLGSGDGPIENVPNVPELTQRYGWSDEYGFGNAQIMDEMEEITEEQAIAFMNRDM